MKEIPVISTEFGKIQGYVEKDVNIFKGIPYALPPIGNLRFSPPVDTEPWNNVLDATKFGPYPIQGPYNEQIIIAPQPQDESCLTLNIWAPLDDHEKKPVMLWLYGGSFEYGGSANPKFDGLALANRGKVVVVSMNYRLGLFGFLHLPGKTTNVGILDQLAVLKWINQNIENFGGDPNNVTIFGESAGGSSVIFLLTMPLTKGLFHRAIIQSACIIDPKPTVRSTKRIFHNLGIKYGDLDSLREVPTNKLIKAQNDFTNQDLLAGTFEIMNFRPSIDEDTIPQHPVKAIQQGITKEIDLIIGTNLNEINFWSVFDPTMKNIDIEGVQKRFQSRVNKVGLSESVSNKVVKMYQKCNNEKSPFEIYNLLDTDFTYRIPALRIAEEKSKFNPNTYNYIFSWGSSEVEGKLGAPHAIEIPFVFGTLDKTVPTLSGLDFYRGHGPKEKEISQKIMDMWISFARNGVPNSNDIIEWPNYEVKTRNTMFINNRCEIIPHFLEKERSAWDGIIYEQFE